MSWLHKIQDTPSNPESGLASRVNSPTDPVRLEGPNGDFWIAKDSSDANSIIVGAYVQAGTCATYEFCLFFLDDSSATRLGLVGSHSWPGRSIIYATDGSIYGWDAGYSLTGGNWTTFGKKFKWEFSKTPFSGSEYGRVTETTVYTGSGSGEPYPSELSARGNEWFDNGDKYYLTTQGYYKMSRTTSGAAFTYTPQDLSDMYVNGTGGSIGDLTWADPLTGETKNARALYLYGQYVYYKKGDTIYRYRLDGSGTRETIVTDPSVYNFEVVNHWLLLMTPTQTKQLNLNSIPTGASVKYNSNIRLESVVHLN